jgi:hypothetical protein
MSHDQRKSCSSSFIISFSDTKITKLCLHTTLLVEGAKCDHWKYCLLFLEKNWLNSKLSLKNIILTYVSDNSVDVTSFYMKSH